MSSTPISGDSLLASTTLLAVLGSCVSAGLTWVAIRYARRRLLFDLPGRRRSHSLPTPRGGGIGMLIATLCIILLAFALSIWPSWPAPTSLVTAIVLTGFAGWIDDHGGLRPRWRLLAHGAAAVLLVSTFMTHVSQMAVTSPWSLLDGRPLLWLVPIAMLGVIAIVWSINLHNFMDGIDGILTAQVVFVFAVLAMLCARFDESLPATQLVVFAAIAAGFLPFNFPRARVFMGDVGSGVLGLLVAVAVLWQLDVPRIAAATGIVACSAFVTDASCTLLSRMLRGRRWYSAHREHLYQWLVRSGFSHARVVALYMGWNLLIVLPVVCWMNRTSTLPGQAGIFPALVLYVAAGALWYAGKRWCLDRSKRRG